jgi:protein TonB
MDPDRSLLSIAPGAAPVELAGPAKWPSDVAPQDRPAAPGSAVKRRSVVLGAILAIAAHGAGALALWPLIRALPSSLPASVETAIEVDLVAAVAEPERAAAAAPEPEPQVTQPELAALPEPPAAPGDNPLRPAVEEVAPPAPARAPVVQPEKPAPRLEASPERVKPPDERPTTQDSAPARQAAPRPRAPHPAQAERTGTNSRQQAASYAAIVAAHLRRFHQYPREELARGASGTVRIRFSLTRGGHLAGASVAQGSPSPALNSAALTAVRRASPFPQPPATISDLTFVVPLRFETN